MVIQTAEFPFLTRLIAPKRRGSRVLRRRLLEVMKARINRRVQVVCGPAGYGKTSLLMDLADQIDFPVGWYSLAPEDSDPAIFVRNCLRSIRNCIGDFGADHPAHSQVGEPADWAVGLGSFINALQCEIPDRLVLVFDDLHWIHDVGEVGQALNLLVERAPDNIHFVLGSRVWPSLKCLPKLAVDGELSGVNVKDLCFTIDETRELLGFMWDREVTPAEAQEVNNQTKGWPAAIVLTAKNEPATSVPDLDRSSSTSDEGMLFGYLSNEIFDKQPEPLKHFLMRTSILKDFTTGQCSSLFGIENPQAIIDRIIEMGLFLDERVGSESVYEFHVLFRNFLANRYKSENPGDYLASHNAAAVYFYHLKDYDLAIHHFIESGNCEKAVEAIKAVSGSYYAQGKWQPLESLLNRLPPNVLEADHELVLLMGQILTRLGNPTEALELLDRLTGEVAGETSETRGNALVAKSTAYRRLGHLELATSAAFQGLEILLDANCSPEYIAEAHKQLGNAYGNQGEYDLAKHHFKTGLELINKGSLRLHSLICNDLGATYLELGELDLAAVYLEQARGGLNKLGSQSLLPDTLTNLALVYFEQGEFDLALEEIQNAIDIAQEIDYPRVLAAGFMNRAIFQGAKGDHDQSLSSAVQALALSNQLLDPRLIAESTNVLGEAYRKLGEASKAEILLRHALIEAENSGQRYIAATYNISLGKVYCQIGSYDQALESLSNAENQLTDLNSLRPLGEVKIYQAAAYYRCGKIKETLACLSLTEKLWMKDGFDGFLLADSNELLDVLRFGMAKRVGWKACSCLVARINSNQPSQGLAQLSPGQANPELGLPGLKVCSLGQARVWLDAHEVTDGEWRSKKAKELFYYLLARKNIVSHEEIVESLWPDVSLDLSTSALKTNVYRLRQALFFDCIQAHDSGYSINPAVSVEFDVDEYKKCLRSSGSSEVSLEERHQYLERAVQLHAGPFLGGFDYEWCDELRSEVEVKYQAALMNLAAFRTASGEFQQAIELLEKAIDSDPFNDEAQYQCILNYINCDEPFLALQKLRKFAKLSADELGCNLPARFSECHQRIKQLIPNSS